MMFLFHFGAKRKTLSPADIYLFKENNRNTRACGKSNKASNLFACITYNLSIIRSELIWAWYVVSQNLSYISCDNIKATLKVKFPRIVPETFSKSSSKTWSNWPLFQFSEVATGGFLLKSFANLAGKYLCWSLSLIKF